MSQVAHQKMIDVSESLWSLTNNEWMSESLIPSFLGKNEQFAKKTDERIPSPASHCVEVHQVLKIRDLAPYPEVSDLTHRESIILYLVTVLFQLLFDLISCVFVLKNK